jgi:hypothetical protein
MKTNRRKFIATASALAAAGSLPSFAAETEKTMLSHHVFFWLKNPSSTADRDKLIEGLKTLKKIDTIRSFHIGVPASTEKRDVVDNSYSVSELMFFDNVEGQNVYQEHAIHKAFVENYSALWSKVIVYDSIDV